MELLSSYNLWILFNNKNHLSKMTGLGIFIAQNVIGKNSIANKTIISEALGLG